MCMYVYMCAALAKILKVYDGLVFFYCTVKLAGGFMRALNCKATRIHTLLKLYIYTHTANNVFIRDFSVFRAKHADVLAVLYVL